MDLGIFDIRPAQAADPAELLARADALRDARDWAEAAQAYADYLRLRAEDQPIWVQYGHCLKEGGDTKGALLLYREAERLRPDDADVQLQIGHALKLLGRGEEAFRAYARAAALDPGNLDARLEMLALDPPPDAAPVAVPQPAPAPEGGHALVFDASDLVEYFRTDRAPTGIQRVQINIIGEALRGAAGAPAAVAGFDTATGQWREVPRPLFERLARLSGTGADAADPAWVEAVTEVREALRAGPPLPFAQGARLVNLGTSWWIPDYARRVREAKARCGLRYIPFLHDCIPLLVPEHCSVELVGDFARWFAALCTHADAVLTNSRCTQADFDRLRRELLPGIEIPSFVVPLDARAPEAAEAAAPIPGVLRDRRPYVLFVGTLESRKNHLLVFNAWLGLMRRHGVDAVPDLVCVGKRGWLAEAALALHENSALLQAKVQLLHNVPDAVLDGLYRGCLFTLYNSFYEGWGLPVTESLSHGKVPLVPDHSSLREAGGAGAVYFPPQSEPELMARLEALIWDEGFRRGQEERLAREVRLRSWAEVAAQLLDCVAAELPALPPPAGRLPLGLGQVHELRKLPGPAPSLGMVAADLLREGSGWAPLEEWGCWATTAGPCLLRLPVGAEPGALRAYLEVVAPPGAGRCRVRAWREGRRPPGFRAVAAEAGEAVFCLLDLPPGEGAAMIELDTAGAGDPRGMGVRSVMVCRPDDLAARLDYLERRALPRVVLA